jgi:hypothetical protein
MNLLEKSKQLFDLIKKQPLRDEIQKMVVQFKLSKYGISDKNYPTSLLGLLLIDQEKNADYMTSSSINTISANQEDFLSWDKEKRQILFDVAKQIYSLNELCIEPLAKTKELPHYTYVLNPYNWFPDAASYYNMSLASNYKKHLFNLKEAKEIASIFQETPAFKYAVSTLQEAKTDIRQIHMEQAVLQLDEKLVEAGVRNGIDMFGERGKRKLDVFHSHLISLLCIKDSLSNLNQLIYQALLQDKLAVIDRNDVFDYELSLTESGRGLAVKYLISNVELFRVRLSDLIILNLESYGIDNQPCRIEKIIFGGEFADTSDIEVRTIDENLNAYKNFIFKLQHNFT